MATASIYRKRAPRHLLGLAFVLIACGCNRVDSWGRYLSGGAYPSNNFGIDSAGSTLVVSSPLSGHGDIYQFDLVAGTHKQITDTELYEANPSISLDGTKIVYSRESPGSGGSLWLYDTQKKSRRQLTAGSFYDMPWGFSPDGRHIMVFRTPVSSKHGECVIIASDREDHTEIRDLGFAAFAPDSSRYCCSRYLRNGKHAIVYIGNLNDRSERELGNGSIPEWSPAGDVILYATENGEERALIPVDGGKGTSLGDMRLATFSPTGKEIFYIDATAREVWVHDTTTGEAALVANAGAHIQRLISTKAGVFCIGLMKGDRVGVIVRIDTSTQKAIPLINIRDCRWLPAKGLNSDPK